MTRDVSEVQLSASLMCADFLHLGSELDSLALAGIQRWHFDVMDGHFVPNITMGRDILKAIAQYSPIPLDVHLMVDKPEDFIGDFVSAGARRIYFHFESTRAPHRLAQAIRDLGCECGVAINPATPIESLATLVQLVDSVLFMSVDPGFAGQPLVPNIHEKVQRFCSLRHLEDVETVVDGHIDLATAKLMVNAGARGLVLGTSALFGQNVNFSEAILQLRMGLSGEEMTTT